jgi:DNA-binding CsgD family transcriptional regulator/PAS domain-containing protein
VDAATADTLELAGLLHDGVTNGDAWASAIAALRARFRDGVVVLASSGPYGADFGLEMHGASAAFFAEWRNNQRLVQPNAMLARLWSVPLCRLLPPPLEENGAYRESPIWDTNVRHDYERSLGAVLGRTPERLDLLALGRRRRDPDFEPGELALFAALIPHFARALRTRREFQRLTAERDSLAAALDRVPRGIILTGPDGTIRHANRAAERMLGDGGAVTTRRGRLVARRSADTARIEALVSAASATAIGRAGVASDAVALPMEGSTVAAALVAEPLAPQHAEDLGGVGAGALLFLSDPAASRRASVSRLAAVYGLTPAEAALAAEVAGGSGLGAAAAVLRISANTAKTQLKAVFGKVGVGRQAELVHRIMADLDAGCE